ncbi:hypothetical protein FRX31_018077 [Thalictrum thalictroides]|uniref:Uncharacterized protein n=1 Tax=Thalictrum thalictroides TaxID=46969 RepID=A0A7J6W5L3_THATH|nr:hypothetical protein FRX31_018077 [Thalictrum thalictroides]
MGAGATFSAIARRSFLFYGRIRHLNRDIPFRQGLEPVRDLNMFPLLIEIKAPHPFPALRNHPKGHALTVCLHDRIDPSSPLEAANICSSNQP